MIRMQLFFWNLHHFMFSNFFSLFQKEIHFVSGNFVGKFPKLIQSSKFHLIGSKSIHSNNLLSGCWHQRFHIPLAFGFCGPPVHIFKAAHASTLQNVSSTRFSTQFVMVPVSEDGLFPQLVPLQIA